MRAWLRSVLPAEWFETQESGDAEAFRKVTRRWLGANFLTWMRTLGESGYGAPTWPVEYGGLGRDWVAQRIVREELDTAELPTVYPNILGVGMAGPVLMAHGTPEQCGRHVKKILTGEEIWCQLFSEPAAGSDVAAVTTRAVRDGDEWVVNGQKVWTSIAQISRFGMLIARTDPDAPKHQGITYFICPMDAPGVSVRPLRQLTGDAEFNEVFFDDARIPAENVVGEVNGGWAVAKATLANERVALSGVAMQREGGIKRVIELARSVGPSGLPASQDPVLRQRLVQLYIESEIKDVTAFRAMAARLAGTTPGPEGSIGKLFAAEFNQRMTELEMAIYGAWSQVTGDVAEFEALGDATARFLRARANTIEGGTSEIQRNIIGERVLGLPSEPRVDVGVPFQEIATGV